jgi:hypothetical protein
MPEAPSTRAEPPVVPEAPSTWAEPVAPEAQSTRAEPPVVPEAPSTRAEAGKAPTRPVQAARRDREEAQRDKVGLNPIAALRTCVQLRNVLLPTGIAIPPRGIACSACPAGTARRMLPTAISLNISASSASVPRTARSPERPAIRLCTNARMLVPPVRTVRLRTSTATPHEACAWSASWMRTAFRAELEPTACFPKDNASNASPAWIAGETLPSAISTPKSASNAWPTDTARRGSATCRSINVKTDRA